MSNAFEVLREDFYSDPTSVRTLVESLSAPNTLPSVRLAAANASTLLVASMFEEFIRGMARETARAIVARASSISDVPDSLVKAVGRRTLESLSREKIEQSVLKKDGFTSVIARMQVAHEFVIGDLSKNIYDDLIHNENNMRPEQINQLFGVSGFKDVCGHCASYDVIAAHFGVSTPGVAREKLYSAIEEFFRRRNEIAHSLNSGRSDGPTKVFEDIVFFEVVASALCSLLVEELVLDKSEPEMA